MENKNSIIRIARTIVVMGVLIVLFFLYTGLDAVKNDMVTIRKSQDTIKVEITRLGKEYNTHNFNDSIFKNAILPIVKNNTELISKNLK